MKWVHRSFISLTIAFFAVCCGAVLLFNWNALGWKALSVPTGSMRPAIPPGSLVLMHRVPVTTLKVGDVITYANPLKPGSTVTHRIIKSYKLDGKIPAFITKGDANPSPDRPVVGGQVQGKAVWHVPYVGGWLAWSKTWVGLAVLVYVPALLIMIEQTMKLNEYYRRAKAYKWALAAAHPEPRSKLATATAISVIMVAGSALFALPAAALLRSNSVTLGPNKISVAAIPPQCTGGNSSTTTITTTGSGNVNISNSNTQNAQSGNATSNGGSATSGNASNCNSTTITVTIH